MDESATIESFAAELAQASKPEQPATGSAPATNDPDGGAEATTDDALEGLLSEEANPETGGDEQQAEGQPEQPQNEGSGEGENDPVHSWTTASGEKFEVKLSELREGYLRTQDYTQKTQALAENVKRAQADIQFQANAIQAMAGELGEVQALQAQIAQFNGIDWATAERQDPQAVIQAQTKLLLLKQQLAEVQQRAGGRLQQLQQAQQAQLAQAVSATEQHLVQKIPGISREEVGKVFSRMAQLGATETELHHMRAMPWLVEAAVYANRWLELQSKKPEVQNKVRNLPPPQKVAPRAAVPTSKTDEAIKAIRSTKTMSPAQFASLLATTRK